MWRAVLGHFGAGSTIGPRWRIEDPGAVFIADDVFMGCDGWISVNTGVAAEPRLIVGRGSYIGNYFLVSLCSQIEIEEKVMISERVYVGDCNHRHDNRDLPIIDQGVSFGGNVRIGAGSWIGVGAAIMPGVSIGKNCVIGANAVVTHDIADGATAVGSPAKVVSS